MIALIELRLHRFHHHNGIIDHGSDGKHKREQGEQSGNQKAIEIGEKARLSVLWKLADAYERSGMKTEQIQTYGQLIEWEQDPIQLEEAGVRKMKLEAAQGDYKQAAETGKKVLERIEASEKITKMLKGYELYKGEEGES